MVTSSSPAPSTVSRARPREHSNRQFVIAIALNPPFDSVPNLIRPVGAGILGGVLPGAVEQRALVVAADQAVRDRHVLRGAELPEAERALQADSVVPRANSPSSSRSSRCWQQSMSIPSRLVSILTPVDRQVVDPGREDSKPAAVLDRDVAQDDVAAVLQRDGLVADRSGARRSDAWPRLRPLPKIRPGPVIETSVRSSPQIRLSCQWLWPASWYPKASPHSFSSAAS